MSSDDERAPLLGPQSRQSQDTAPVSVPLWPKAEAPPLWWPWQPDPGPGKVKVEPKVFFANERTFLSWVHFGITLGALSLALLNFGQGIAQISGLLFTLIAILSLVYALYKFLVRGTLIRTMQPGPYQDVYGPGVMVATLFFVTLLNFALKLGSSEDLMGWSKKGALNSTFAGL